MSVTSGKFYGAGARVGRLYQLDQNAVPAGTSATVPYEGIEILGVQGLEANIPDAKKVPVLGRDRLEATITLPRTEPSTGTITMSSVDFDLVASLAGVKKFAIGEAAAVAYGTDQQGSESDVCVMVTQYGKDAVSKLTRYRTVIYPVTTGVLNPSSLTADASKSSMQITAQSVERLPWHEPLSTATHGCTKAETIEFETETEPMLATWVGDNSATEFNFAANHQAAATGKILAAATVATDGTYTDVLSSCTKATDGITISPAPGTGVKIICLYEWA